MKQTRRKLDDVGKKLEILYDKLREGSVSDLVVETTTLGFFNSPCVVLG